MSSNKMTKKQAIKVFLDVTDKDDPYWSNLVEDFYDEKTDTMPTIYDVFEALGILRCEVTEAEFGIKEC